jgi:hypothetical protein
MPSLDNGISPSLLYGNANAAQSPYNPSYHAPAPTTGSFPSPYNYSPNQKPMVPHPRPYSAIVAGTSPNAAKVQVENGNPPEAQNQNGGAPSPSNDDSPLKRPADDTGGADSFAPPSSVKRQRPNTDSTVIAPANIIPSNTQPAGHINGPAPPNGQTQPVGQVPANQPPQGMPPHMYHQFHNWNMFNFPQMGRPQGGPPGGDYAQYPPPPPLPGAQSRSGSVPLTNGTPRSIAGVPPRNGPVASPAGCYSRKEKALGLLAQKLIALYECQQPPSGNSNMMQVLSIDQTASKLGVERRRIYDIINILEALDVVTKKARTCIGGMAWEKFRRRL